MGHKDTKDTRAIYAEINLTLSTSTSHKLQLTKLTNYLCTARINTGNWRGTQQNFVLHFIETARQCQEAAGTKNQFAQRHLIELLNMAVSEDAQLGAVL